MKVCTQCNQALSLDKFALQKRGKSGRHSFCLDCRKVTTRTKQAVAWRIYSTQLSKANRREYLAPAYSKEELYTWLMSNPEFHLLYENWEESGYLSEFKPSVDRKNDLISYRFDNLQVITWAENKQKNYDSRIDSSNPKVNLAVDMLTMEGTFIKRFPSIQEASRYCGKGNTGLIQSAIVQRKVTTVRNGKVYEACRQSAYGYKWRYSNIPNAIAEIK